MSLPTPEPLPKRSPAAVTIGQGPPALVWPEVVLAWSLVAAAALLLPASSRTLMAAQVVALVWAGRLTVHRNPVAGVHAILMIAAVVLTDVLAGSLPALLTH